MCTKIESILSPRIDEVEYKSLESKKQEVYHSMQEVNDGLMDLEELEEKIKMRFAGELKSESCKTYNIRVQEKVMMWYDTNKTYLRA
jgi:hypothetical protein